MANSPPQVASARVYSTGASQVYGAGVDHKTLLRWCVPPGIARRCGGAPTVTVVIRARLENPGNEGIAVDLSDLFATIRWGSGEDTGPDNQVADVDVVGGSSFTCQAWTLDVAITYPGAPSAAHPQVRFDVSVGIGTSGKAGVSASATRTVKIGAIPGGGNVAGNVLIPPFAVGARVACSDLDTAIPTLDLEQLRAIGGAIVSIARIGKLETSAVPIARGLGARAFQVRNSNVAAANDVAVIFDVCPN